LTVSGSFIGTWSPQDRQPEARRAAAAAIRIDPEFTLASAPEVLPFKRSEDLTRFLDGLRKAGLPE
jgi:hypothetical protein